MALMTPRSYADYVIEHGSKELEKDLDEQEK